MAAYFASAAALAATRFSRSGISKAHLKPASQQRGVLLAVQDHVHPGGVGVLGGVESHVEDLGALLRGASENVHDLHGAALLAAGQEWIVTGAGAVAGGGGLGAEHRQAADKAERRGPERNG